MYNLQQRQHFNLTIFVPEILGIYRLFKTFQIPFGFYWQHKRGSILL